MSEYPEDIMKAANEVALEIWKYLQSGGYMGHHETITPIAAAISAERNRCAKVARERFTEDNVLKNTKGKPYATGSAAIVAAGRVADAILKGGAA